VKWSEWRCFQLISIPLVQWIGPLKVMGISCNWGLNGRIGFWVWAAWEILNTLSQGATRHSQSLSAITTIKTLYCVSNGPHGPLFAVWRKMPHLLPLFIIDLIKDDILLALAVVALLVMFTESVWYGLLTWTISSGNDGLYGTDLATGQPNQGPVTYDAAEPACLAQVPAGTVQLGTWGCGYHVLMSRIGLYQTNHTRAVAAQEVPHRRLHMYHADQLMLLAEPSGMHSLRGFSTDWCLARAKEELRLPRGTDGILIRPISIVGMQMMKIVTRSFFESVTNICAMEIRIILLAYAKETMGTIMVTMLLSAAFQVVDQVGCLKAVWNFWTSAEDKVQWFERECQAAATDPATPPDQIAEHAEDLARAKQNLEGLASSYKKLSVILFVYVCVLADVVCKSVWLLGLVSSEEPSAVQVLQDFAPA